jgi:hypothetical protein
LKHILGVSFLFLRNQIKNVTFKLRSNLPHDSAFEQPSPSFIVYYLVLISRQVLLSVYIFCLGVMSID